MSRRQGQVNLVIFILIASGALIVVTQSPNLNLMGLATFQITPEGQPAQVLENQPVENQLIMEAPQYQTSGLCGTTIVVSTTLTGSLSCGAGIGIVIGADNIILDCAGYTIQGAAGNTKRGVNATGRLNVTIQNCTVTQFATGVYFDNTNQSTITNDTLTYDPLPGGGDSSGIHLVNSYNNNISFNTANHNDYGIYLNFSSNNTIQNNTASSNTVSPGVGIYLTSSLNNTLINNTASSNTQCGIQLVVSSNNNSLISNIISSNARGIYLVSSLNNTLINNTASSNTQYGIQLVSSSNNNNLTGNTACLNPTQDIFVSSANNSGDNTCDIYNLDSSSVTCNNGCPINTVSISSCTTLNSDTNYTLTADIPNGTDGCMTFNGNKIVLDCNGYAITGPGSGYGIFDSIGTQRSIIKNCAVTNFNTGIYIKGLYNTIIDNTANSNTGYGIWLSSGSNNTLTNNSAHYNNKGIYLSGSNFNNLINNTVHNNTNAGIYLYSSSNNNNLTGNTANNDTETGISLDGSNNNTLTGNTVNSTAIGIYILSSSNNSIIGNTANNNTDIGISLEVSSNNNTLVNNTANGNAKRGIYFYTNSSNNTLIGNTANNNAENSIYIYSGSDNILTNNTVNYNNNGIKVESGSNNNILTGNTACTNTVIDIVVNSSSCSGDNICDNSSMDNSTVTCLHTCAWGSNLAPQINLSLPSDKTQIKNTQTVDFNFTATDDANTTFSCGIYLDNVLNKTNSSVSNYTLTDFQIQGISYSTILVETGPQYSTHAWKINCTDGSLTNVSATRLFTVRDTEAPQVDLSKPDNNMQINNTQSVRFNFTATDYQAIDTTSSCIIYLDGTANKTNTTVANHTLTNFDISGISYGAHTWNVACTDVNSNTNTTSNRTFTINDTQPPQITFLQPDDNANYTDTQTVDFNLTETDNVDTTGNCSIFIDGILNETSALFVNGTMSDFIIDGISYGTHTWNAACIDSSGNLNTTDNRTLNLLQSAAPPVVVTLPVLGAGGTSPATAQTIGAIIPGAPQDVVLNIGDTASFTLSGAVHSVRISALNGEIQITISSNLIKATFTVGQTKDFDTNNNGINDLEITLLSKTNTSVDIRIKALSEAVALITPITSILPPVVQPVCGDGTCNGAENFASCPTDCPLSTAMFLFQQGSLTTFAVLLLVVILAYIAWAEYKRKMPNKRHKR